MKEQENHLKEEKAEAEVSVDCLSPICLDSATDSVNATASPTSTMQITLSLNEVLSIENQLDVYEKVSLIYLLEDNPQIALQNLDELFLRSSQELLYNWAKNQNLVSHKWQEKLVEALCIIQNYKIIRHLGFRKQDLDVRYLPRHLFTSYNVSKVKKALYFLCESLTRTEAEQLLKLVFTDFNDKGLETKFFDSSYLELYFLHWESVGYIKHDNFNNLYRILKQLEHFDMCDSLKRVVPMVQEQVTNNQRKNSGIKNKTVDANTNKRSPEIFEGILNGGSLTDLVSMQSSLSSDNATRGKADNIYKIDPNNPGVCLIINQEYFYTEPSKKYKDLLPKYENNQGNKLENRVGTQKDKEDLEATFKMFGFKTEVVENLIHTDVIKKIDEVIQNVTVESSLFICIMSHGDQGVIYGVNSCRVSVTAIKNIMCKKNRENLSGKPKFLILQSCQGTRCQKEQDEFMTTDGPTSSKQEVVPPRADLFTFWATVPGYGAIRDKRTGSWFIQSLCEKMKDLGNTCHFEDICTAVIGDVSSKKWCQKSEDVAMVPLKDSTLRKLFFLPPIKF
ncbi:caspase-8 [Asbolus verrucosus]|uniref:Caspase-8 n=1 Tax=Asbolus verrucosus TaxID=1661398 RepID=A0A482VRD0_ASBVE|nr:caspase-8 [Asbolus verrucosus]